MGLAAEAPGAIADQTSSVVMRAPKGDRPRMDDDGLQLVDRGEAFLLEAEAYEGRLGGDHSAHLVGQVEPTGPLPPPARQELGDHLDQPLPL